jgi:acyl carrier protein
MTLEAFLEAFEETLQLPRGSAGLDQVLRDLPNWDSMKILDLVFMLEAKSGTAVKIGDAARWRTVADIARLAGVLP